MSLQQLLLKKVDATHEEFFMSIYPNFKKYININFGNGYNYFLVLPKVNCHINDPNPEVINFYKNISETNLLSELKKISDAWLLLGYFSKLSAKEIYISFKDYINNIITSEDIKYMVQAIIFMNINNDAFNLLFDKSFIISIDLFTKSLINKTVDQVKKIKSITDIYKTTQNDFETIIETGLRKGFFEHFQNLINLQNTGLIDCISNTKRYSIWFFLGETSKGNKIVYDNNNNLKCQYGGKKSNSISLKSFIEKFNSYEIKELLKRTSFYNMSMFDFIKSIDIKEDDIIFADFRTNTQYTPVQSDNIYFNDIICSVDFLIESSYNWICYIDNKVLFDKIKNKDKLILLNNNEEYILLPSQIKMPAQ
jgi:hypothetical protein